MSRMQSPTFRHHGNSSPVAVIIPRISIPRTTWGARWASQHDSHDLATREGRSRSAALADPGHAAVQLAQGREAVRVHLDHVSDRGLPRRLVRRQSGIQARDGCLPRGTGRDGCHRGRDKLDVVARVQPAHGGGVKRLHAAWRELSDDLRHPPPTLPVGPVRAPVAVASVAGAPCGPDRLAIEYPR